MFDSEEDVYISDEQLGAWVALLDAHIEGCSHCLVDKSSRADPLGYQVRSLSPKCSVPNAPIHIEIGSYHDSESSTETYINFDRNRQSGARLEEEQTICLFREHDGSVRSREWCCDIFVQRREGPSRIGYDSNGQVTEVSFNHPDSGSSGANTFWEFYEISSIDLRKELLKRWLPYAV